MISILFTRNPPHAWKTSKWLPTSGFVSTQYTVAWETLSIMRKSMIAPKSSSLYDLYRAYHLVPAPHYSHLHQFPLIISCNFFQPFKSTTPWLSNTDFFLFWLWGTLRAEIFKVTSLRPFPAVKSPCSTTCSCYPLCIPHHKTHSILFLKFVHLFIFLISL